MTYRQNKIIPMAVSILLMIVGSSFAVFACNPATLTVCQRFERAEAVFVGILTKAERKSESKFVNHATFTVLEIYKGTVGSVEAIQFGTGDCDPKVDEIGATYFVYKEPYNRFSFVANYTRLLATAGDDLRFAKQVDPKNPVFRISALILGLEVADLRKTRVLISNGRLKKWVPISPDGRFEFSTRRPGIYKVKIFLPRAAKVQWEQLNTFSEMPDGASFSYEVTHRSNGCDSRKIRVSQE